MKKEKYAGNAIKNIITFLILFAGDLRIAEIVFMQRYVVIGEYPKEVRAMQYKIKEGSRDMTFGSCCQHIKHTCPYCHSHHMEDIAFSKHSSHGIFQCPNCLKFYYIEECDQHSATV